MHEKQHLRKSCMSYPKTMRKQGKEKRTFESESTEKKVKQKEFSKLRAARMLQFGDCSPFQTKVQQSESAEYNRLII